MRKNTGSDTPQTICGNEDIPKPVPEKYKTENCRVLSYNKKTGELDIDFKGYGIRLENISAAGSDFVTVKYRGEIGQPGFSCKLQAGGQNV